MLGGRKACQTSRAQAVRHRLPQKRCGHRPQAAPGVGRHYPNTLFGPSSTRLLQNLQKHPSPQNVVLRHANIRRSMIIAKATFPHRHVKRNDQPSEHAQLPRRNSPAGCLCLAAAVASYSSLGGKIRQAYKGSVDFEFVANLKTECDLIFDCYLSTQSVPRTTDAKART